MAGTAHSVWLNCDIATMQQGRYAAIANAALVERHGRIVWIGPRADLPAVHAERTHDGGGQWMLPGLIDCHTHLVFAGTRAEEYEARLAGQSYAGAALEGRGIVSTMARTRAATETDLATTAAARLRRLLAEGVTTVEIKSGYGLRTETELRMLRVARAIGAAQGVRVRTSFLGAHAVPPEFAGRRGDYLDLVIGDMLPRVHAEGLADAVDAFAETIAFTADDVARLFTAARALGLPVKLHADQLSDGGGAALAARFGALSADHLEYCSPAGAAALARAGTVAVLLPGAYLTVGAAQPPPVAALRAHGVRMAVATDCNPGSSPMVSLLLAAALACSVFRLTPEEALAGITCNAAAALGLGDEIGTLAVGMRAEFGLWPIEHPRELAYWMGGVCPSKVRKASFLEKRSKKLL